jgi:hypothetical protein
VKQVSTINKCLVLLYGFQRGREHAEHFLFSDLTRKEAARFKQLVRNRRHFFIPSIPLPFTLIISLTELVEHGPLFERCPFEKTVTVHRSFEVPSVLLPSDDKRIYFHETAGRDHLNVRQLCAVESAANKNPDRSVHVFFQTNHVNLTVDPLVSILRVYPNIAVILINVTDYFAGTVKCFLYVNAIILIMSVLF